ncbi:hypothetical protein LCGC14_2194430 [marine sediment metagenome]|uniref:Uncharacterized protein n=1 Tax=marine sediment metagenome TaxID=412755 RepID=A0A0F9E5M5_9ZZZZ
MPDVKGRDQEAEAMYHVEMTRNVTVVAVDQKQAIERAVERAGHLIIEEGMEFPYYCGYAVTGAESLAPADCGQIAQKEKEDK